MEIWWKKMKQPVVAGFTTTTTTRYFPTNHGLFSFIPAPYRTYMTKYKQTSKTETITMKIETTPIVVSITNFHNLNENFQPMVDFIQTWFAFVLPYAQTKCKVRGLFLYLYLLDFPKELPAPSAPLDIICVNTGVTTSCNSRSTENSILIFRREEWLRVLIHETFHFLGLDFSAHVSARDASTYILTGWWRALPSTLDLCVYESYCDVWATLFQVLLISSTPSAIHRAIRAERQHSMFQCAKILCFYGFSLKDLCQRERKLAYQEKTPVLSYYILKSVAMYFLDDFLLLFPGQFAFPAEKRAIYVYANFLVQGLQQPTYQREIQKQQTRWQKMRDTPYKKTLKMSSIFPQT
jgi:hypothetical protein